MKHLQRVMLYFYKYLLFIYQLEMAPAIYNFITRVKQVLFNPSILTPCLFYVVVSLLTWTVPWKMSVLDNRA